MEVSFYIPNLISVNCDEKQSPATTTKQSKKKFLGVFYLKTLDMDKLWITVTVTNCLLSLNAAALQ